MFGFGKFNAQANTLCCCMGTSGFALVAIKDAHHIDFCEINYHPEATSNYIAKNFSETIDKLSLHGRTCSIILSQSLYQILLMDAPDVAEQEMAKALRWQLKGLIDYPLNDVVIDSFIVPPHGAGQRRKKVFCAVSLQSALLTKLKLFEDCALKVPSVSVAEMALSHLIALEPLAVAAPSIVISFDEEVCQLHVYYNGDLYLLRTLSISPTIIYPNSSANQDMLLEIQRSIDYCLMELKIPEPKQVLFTPNFYEATDLLTFLHTELDKEVKLLEAGNLFSTSAIAPDIIAQSFYAIGGALMSLQGAK